MRTCISKTLLAFLTLLVALAAVAAPAMAQQRQPLVVPGKKKVFQRVIARPEAELVNAAGARQGEPVAPFSIFYVYERRGDLIEVGKTIGSADGFIKADKLIDWRTAVVAQFNNPANRQRSLLFRSSDDIKTLVTAADAPARISALRTEAIAGRASNDSVVAVEPETPPAGFYFLPILGWEMNARLGPRVSGRILKVASLTTDPVAPPPGAQRIGVVFVIDTTTSMGPYIARVRDAVAGLQSDLARLPAGQDMRFGLVGFRQSLAENDPRIEYHVKTFLKLNANATSAAFLDSLSQVKEATVSTVGFNEDSLGGVYQAIVDSDWNGFTGKVIILITDAGPQLPQSGRKVLAPGLGPAQVHEKATSQGILVSVMHLMTPEGASDHQSAMSQYQALARGVVSPSYFPVRNGSVDQFGSDLEEVRKALASEVRNLSEGGTRPSGPTSSRIQDSIAQNFHAMRLKYLGQTQNSRPPSMFEAFVADRDLSEPYGASTEIRVFLTKNELSTMHDAVSRIVNTAESTVGDPGSFFTQLQGAIGRVLNNPSLQVDTLGVELDDLLDGLPYRSPILTVDRQNWVRMGAGGQNQMRMELDSKLAFAKDWLNTPANWIALKQGVPDGEKVTLFPMSQLP